GAVGVRPHGRLAVADGGVRRGPELPPQVVGAPRLVSGGDDEGGLAIPGLGHRVRAGKGVAFVDAGHGGDGGSLAAGKPARDGGQKGKFSHAHAHGIVPALNTNGRPVRASNTTSLNTTQGKGRLDGKR